MIVRATLLGLVLWLLATLAFRFAGDSFFHPGEHLVLFIAAPVATFAIAWLAFRLLGVRSGDEAEAAIALGLPGMILDAYATFNFETVFPNLDPTLDGLFGALMLTAYSALAFAGLMFTKLQPEDERL